MALAKNIRAVKLHQPRFFIIPTSANNIQFTTVQLSYNNTYFSRIENVAFDAEKLRFADTFFVTTYLRKTAMESDRKLVRACGGHDLDRSQCFKWFRKFKSGDFDVNVEDHIKTEKMPNFK